MGTTRTLQQIIPRHDPSFAPWAARLGIGRDENVYVASSASPASVVLRLAPDGTTRRVGKVGNSLLAVTANRAGVIATAEHHFSHRVAFWDADFRPLGSFDEFTVNDTDGYFAPPAVEAGPSGDFYAMDQHALRVLRLNPDGVLDTIDLKRLSSDPKDRRQTVGLRVAEERELLVTAWQSGVIRMCAFDGTPVGTPVRAKPVGFVLSGYDVSDDGHLYVLTGGREVQVYDLNGNRTGTRVLALPDTDHDVTDLRVRGGEFLVRRSDQVTPSARRDHETLFERYDLNSGALIGRAFADVERLTVTYDADVWTAGTRMPLTLAHDPGHWASRPRLTVWLRPLGVPEFTELPLTAGAVTPPADARGLYQLRVTADTDGRYSEYTVDGIVEVRQPGARGTVSIWTPSNRFHYGRGEPLGNADGGAADQITVAARAATGTQLPASVRVRLLRGGEEVAARAVTLRPDGTGTLTFGADVTRALEPGRHVLDADVPGFTVAPQHLEIGPGFAERPGYHLTQYGDIYAQGFPADPRATQQARQAEDLPEFRDVPETTKAYVARARTLGINLFVDRAEPGAYGEVLADQGIHQGTGPDLVARLTQAKDGVAPGKAKVEDPRRRAFAAYGAYGIETQAVLLTNDALLPFLPQGTPDNYERRTLAKLDSDLTEVTEKFLPYAAFRGWTWGANWWLWAGTIGEAAAKDPAERTAYRQALAQAQSANGAWLPVLDTVSDRTFAHKRQAADHFRTVLKSLMPHGIGAITGPYRERQVPPQLVFTGADEVDLHFQAEQIQPPQVTRHMVDFYRRPGRPAWGHPELGNDDGTGGMIMPTLLQQVMRGAHGTGTVTDIGAEHGEGLHAQDERAGGSGGVPGDPRSGSAGKTSVLRALFDLCARLGPVTAGAQSTDPVALVVSTRMQRIEFNEGQYAGVYFQRLYEAYNACLYAQRPASFVCAEDVSADVLRRYQAVLVVGQTVELDPPLAQALAAAGVPVFADATCHADRVTGFTRLDIGFDHVEKTQQQNKDAYQQPIQNNDAAYAALRTLFLDHAAKLRTALSAVTPFAECVDNPEVQLSEWTAGGVRYLWAVNNTLLDWEPGLAWRVGLLCAHRIPVVARVKVRLPPLHQVVDLLTGRPVTTLLGDEFTADLRSVPGRLYAVVPVAHGPLPSASEDAFGPHVRDIAVSADGRSAALTTFNWDHNVHGLDLTTGRTTWRQRLGHHFAYGPVAHAGGYAAQGFDVLSAEGYHLYLLDPSGTARRRFALFGLPKRATDWARGDWGHDLGLNNFAVAPDGSWVATCGDLGLALWDSSGTERWAHQWWAEHHRAPLRLLAADDTTLITFAGGRITALAAADGATLWSLRVADTGAFGGGAVSRDRRTVVIWSDAEGGRLYVLRGGALRNTIPAAADEVSVSGDGSLIAATKHRQLKVFGADGGLLWTYTGDDLLRRPRVSPDGTRVAVGSELGTLAVLTRDGAVVGTVDLKALPVPAWLPDGDLLAATWLGTVVRYRPDLRPRWQSRLTPTERDIRSTLRAPDPTPLVRRAWGNAAPTPSPLTNNLLKQTGAVFRTRLLDRDQEIYLSQQNDTALLLDGSASPPARPWLPWWVINSVDSGWHGKFELTVDTYRSLLRLDGVTIAEDPAHPESWLRDVRLQWWDTRAGRWVDGPMLLSDQAVHTHMFSAPLVAAWFRFVTTGGGAWPAGNLRLGELVFHGAVLGNAHRDVIDRRGRATLFEDRKSDLRTLFHGALSLPAGRRPPRGRHLRTPRRHRRRLGSRRAPPVLRAVRPCDPRVGLRDRGASRAGPVPVLPVRLEGHGRGDDRHGPAHRPRLERRRGGGPRRCHHLAGRRDPGPGQRPRTTTYLGDRTPGPVGTHPYAAHLPRTQRQPAHHRRRRPLRPAHLGPHRGRPAGADLVPRPCARRRGRRARGRLRRYWRRYHRSRDSATAGERPSAFPSTSPERSSASARMAESRATRLVMLSNAMTALRAATGASRARRVNWTSTCASRSARPVGSGTVRAATSWMCRSQSAKGSGEGNSSASSCSQSIGYSFWPRHPQ
ncbi:hypothetical protein RB200_28835 [Streptomyces sp. PmtG]